VFTNINGLLLDHELIDGSDTGGLANWHEWAKPGAVICFDEVQREWKPRANGSKVPKCIEMLETHRHMGVDFIILTQHPGLIDQNIRALVGRHLHVRRFGGMGAAIVYEWDHCSRNLLYSKSLGKKPFRYSKEVFNLYKSAELHTKPKTTIPTLAFVVLGALGLAGAAIPYAASRVADKSEQAAKVNDKIKADHPAAPAGPAGPAVAPASIPQVSAGAAEVEPSDPEPPFPLESLQLVGSMEKKDGKRVYLLMRGRNVVTHDVYMSAGYAFVPVDGCAVRVQWYGQTRFMMCEGGPLPSAVPSPAPVVVASASQDNRRFVLPPDPQSLQRSACRAFATCSRLPESGIYGEAMKRSGNGSRIKVKPCRVSCIAGEVQPLQTLPLSSP
jgi:hypothetical protein